ncbi:transcriptional regulator [Staphylococcus schleiferi]|uniref:helix-turn-helix transcriptional regulator n=1 Tax=Staphylococcus sp. 191 TaxID=2070016 RepID=UPI0013F3B652|nr:helix-turn-helix transcriptional regulator [Staphylococcus sp. 191]NHA36264.1 transcriptional regulator [Staphylococcus schleiferi]NHB71823.1 transcriptional regulator [Staphylococcus sp. 191]
MSNRLKALRAREGYNQTQLAKQAGISRQTVSLIERNEFTPSILTAVKICRVIKERVEDVFIIEEEE